MNHRFFSSRSYAAIALFLSLWNAGEASALPTSNAANSGAATKAAVNTDGPAIIKTLQKTTWHLHQQSKSDLTDVDKTRSEAANREIARLDAVIAANPRDAKSLVQRALAQLDVVKVGFVFNEYGQPKKAIADLDVAIALDSTNSDARALRARLLLADLQNSPQVAAALQGKPASDMATLAKTARADLDVLLQKHPTWARGRLDRADALRFTLKGADSDNDLLLMLSDAALAVSLDKTLRVAAMPLVSVAGSRAMQLQQQKIEPEKRAAIAELALQIGGETPNWLQFRSDSFASFSNRSLALKAIETQVEAMAKAKAPAESQMRLLLVHGRIAALAGQTEIAKRDFEMAAKLAPQSIEPILAQARSLQEIKKPADALRVLNEGQNKAANNYDFYALRGTLAQDLGQWKLAAEDYTKAKNIQPQNIEVRMVLAQAQQQSGNLADAITTLREASTRSGFNMEHKLMFAIYLALSGDEAGAREQYRGVALNRATLARYLANVKAAQAKSSNAALTALQTLIEADIARQ